MLFSTFSHELSHGVSALLVGGRFETLVLYPDGSGAAQWAGMVKPYQRAFIAMGGLLGPALVASVCFVMGRRPDRARQCLILLALALFITEVLVVHNKFALAFVGGLAVIFLIVGIHLSQHFSQLVVIFTAVQLSLSIFSRTDYLFSPYAHSFHGNTLSDVEFISRSIGLPYWFWGIVCGAFSVFVLFMGIRILLRKLEVRIEPVN
jgi:hypothetical protein